MQGIRFHHFGNPVDVLRVEELPEPRPGFHQVLMRMRARPINPSDLLTVRGLYGALPKLPASPGLEGVGTIEGIGENVRGFSAGQRAVPLGVLGTWQEFIVADSNQLIPVPDSISDPVAAQFVVNPLTAWIMVT